MNLCLKLEDSMKTKVTLLLISLVITAYGVPSWSYVLSPIAAALGMGLFWYVLESFKGAKKKILIAFHKTI